MAQSHIYTSAITRLGAPGNTALTSSNIIGVNQSFELTDTPGRHDLFDTAQNSVRAVDTFDHEVKASIKIENNDLQLTVAAYQTGGSLSAGVLTVGQLSVPQYCRVEADLVDTSGNIYHFVATKAKPKGFTLSAGITEFGKVPIEFDLYPDPNAAVAGTVYTL